MYKNLALCFCLFILQFFSAHASLEANSFCFAPGTNITAVKKHVETILAPKDEIFASKNRRCLVVNMNSSRVELTRKWIEKRFKVLPELQSDYVPSGRCRLKVERISKGKESSKDLRVGRRNAIGANDQNSFGKRVTSLLLEQGKRGGIRYNDQLIGVKCLRGGQDNYQVEIIVDERRGGVSSTVSLRRGQRVNIGQIIDQNSTGNRGVDLSSGASFSKQKSYDQFSYFLMID